MQEIYLRRMDSLEAKPIPGTEGEPRMRVHLSWRPALCVCHHLRSAGSQPSTWRLRSLEENQFPFSRESRPEVR
jgi:hypothetical protein